MGRLIIIAVLAIALTIAVTSVMALAQTRKSDRAPKHEDAMPDTFKTVAYFLLIALMFGVTTGWLAG